MSSQRTHWYLDQTTVHRCGKELRVYTDGRKTYAYCPVCDQKVELGDFGTTYRVSTEQNKEVRR